MLHLKHLASTRISLLSKSAVKYSSTVAYSWGEGSQGELGHSSFKTSATLTGEAYIQQEPRRIARSRRFATLAVGTHFSLGLDHEGHLYQWGEYPGCTKQSNEPVLFESNILFKKIACGKTHCAAISTDGQVYTWGKNGSWMTGGGFLGHGDNTAVVKPKRIEAFFEYGAKASEVVCGGRHTVIRTTDGELLSCGVGEYGRLGTGSSFDAPTPVPLDSLIDENIISIAAGSSHTLALAKGGKLFVWGRNDYGQLGFEDSYMDMYSLEDMPRHLEASALRDKNITQILAGRGRSGVITEDGVLFTWGHRANHVPTPMDPKLFDNMRVTKAAFGGDIMGNSCLAVITEDGSLWTSGDAGSNMMGRQLGMTQTPLTRFPEPSRLPAFVGRRVADVFMGPGQHALALVEAQDAAAEL